MANFRTKARAIDLLGKNQIADLPTAITELWKNGYDAYGDYLDAKLFSKGYKGLEDDVFMLSDDGHGMTGDDILNKWIVIGTENKRNLANVVPAEDRFGKPIRVPLGEKGIGRLSVSYLGDHMIMVTKKKDKNPQMLFMNWRIMENYEMFLDDIEIPFDEVPNFNQIKSVYKFLISEYLHNFDNSSWNNFGELEKDLRFTLQKYSDLPDVICKEIEAHFSAYGHGTIFIIFNPIKELVDLKLERESDIEEVRNDIIEQTKYVKSALSGLFNPFDEALVEQREHVLGDTGLSPSFHIYFPNGEDYDFLGNDFFTKEDFDACEHWIDGFFDEKGTFHGKIKVFGDVEEYTYTERIKPKALIGNLVIKMAFWEGAKSSSSMPEEKWIVYDSKGEIYSGLYIYRDGFRVLPYGRTDFDFLEFEKRRSINAGMYYFSHRKMFGFLGITKQGNPELIDKSGREGFVANDAYRELKRLLVGFFKKIAAEKYGTKSTNRIVHKEEKEKEKQRLALVAEEKKKNRTAVMEVRKQVEVNVALLAEKREELRVVLDTTENLSEETDLGSVIERLENLSTEISMLQVFVPSDVSLYSYDSVEDMVTDHNKQCEMLFGRAEMAILKLSEQVEIKSLRERYLNKFQITREKVIAEREELLFELEKVLGQISENVKINSQKFLSPLYEEKSVNGNVLSDIKEIQQRIGELDKLSRDFDAEIKVSYQPLIRHLLTLSKNEKWSALLNAYKTTEAELSHRLDLFYELAQVGMAIDVVDHEFNALYEQIKNNINKLSQANLSPDYSDILDDLRMEFQHMEDNNKLLMPLYRKTRRRKSEFFGADIEKIILKFYEGIFEKNGIDFCVSEEFRKYRFYSFESIIMPVFLNVINNAVYWVEFGENEKKIQIVVKNDKILIADSGSQMTHSELTRCFELFYTKKSADSGRGIGLFLARRSLQSIDMNIEATNDPLYNYLGGACFVISKEEEE